MMRETVDVLGIAFDKINKTQLTDLLIERIEKEEKCFVVTANPEIVMYARRNKAYQEVIERANYIIADGIGVIFGAKILKNPLPERIPGFEIFTDLLAYANDKKKSVYFLGATEEVILQLRKNVEQNYPNLHIAGTRNGFFDLNDQGVFESVQASKADMVFVATGYPRQEQWIRKHLDEFDKGIFIGVGGSFDVLAGKVKRAPEIWQKLNLEWFYRLASQPSRWRRMFVLPKFMLVVLKERFFKGRA